MSIEIQCMTEKLIVITIKLDYSKVPSKSTVPTYANMYLNMISSNGTFLPIDKQTRVIGNFRSIIDHVITNDISNTIFSCVFLMIVIPFRSIIDHVITNDISNTIFPCVFLMIVIPFS